MSTRRQKRRATAKLARWRMAQYRRTSAWVISYPLHSFLAICSTVPYALLREDDL